MTKSLLTLICIAITALALACSSNDSPQVTPPPANQTSDGPTATQPASSGPPTSTSLIQAPTSTPRHQISMPTKPLPIAGLLTPTIPPTSAPQAKPTSPSQTSPGQTTGANPGGTGSGTTDTPKIPKEPIFDDKTLLQDIYAKMDLSQFALDPNAPIPPPIDADGYHDINTDPPRLRPGGGINRSGDTQENYIKMPSVFSYQEIKDHPYLHLFPGLQSLTTFYRNNDIKPRYPIKYHPYFIQKGMTTPRDYQKNNKEVFRALNGIEQFLFNPWYQPIDATHATYTSHFPTGIRYNPQHWGPHYFGNNSTKAVLSKGVAETLAAAVHPGVDYKPIPLSPKTKWYDAIGKNWTFEEYLRTPVATNSHTDSLKTGRDTRPYRAFRTPITTWEFVHDQLPIVKVTSYNTTVLPFVDRDERPSIDRPSRLWYFYNEGRNDKRFENFCEAIDTKKLPRRLKFGNITFDRSYCPGYPTRGISPEALVHLLKAAPPEHFDILFPSLERDPSTETTFAVSFIIAFQNRWESFTNPDRWLIRFYEDLKPRPTSLPEHRRDFEPSQGAIDTEFDQEHFPNYWHTTDYMQHSIIGPVVVQVYESETLQPGIYHFTPTITNWQAPEYIVPDDRQLIVRTPVFRTLDPDQPFILESFTHRYKPSTPPGWAGRKIGDTTIAIGALRLEATPYSPNPGYPLPGHVMTASNSAPGTDIWEFFNMDDNDW